MALIDKIRAKGFTVDACGIPPVLRIEPAANLTDTQRATIAARHDDLLCDALFPWVDVNTDALRAIRAGGHSGELVPSSSHYRFEEDSE